jgi:hypothetical protein
MIEVKPDLPVLPLDMIIEVYRSIQERKGIQSFLPPSGDTHSCKYEFMTATDKLIQWLNENIAVRSWGVQVIEGQIPLHTDWQHAGTKFLYLIDTGGENISTRWYYEGKEVASYVCNMHTWYTLQVRIPHDADMIWPGRYRIAVTQGNDSIPGQPAIIRHTREYYEIPK